jgi:AP-2 complex subunit alpha
LLDILKKVVKKTDVTKNVNKNNTDHGILFEAVSLIIHYGNSVPEALYSDIIKLLGVFVGVREPNLKYLGLESMCKLGQKTAITDTILTTVIRSLKGNDISIKRRALDLLYIACT